MDEVRWCISFDENVYMIYTDDILETVMLCYDLDEVDDMSWYDEVVMVLYDDVWWNVCDEGWWGWVWTGGC